MIKNILIIVLLIIGVNLMGMSNQEILEKMFLQNDINEYSKLEYYAKDSFTMSIVNKETPLFRLLDKNLKKIGKEHSIESLNKMLTDKAIIKILLNAPNTILEYNKGDNFIEYSFLLLDIQKRKIFFDLLQKDYKYQTILIDYIMSWEFVKIFSEIDIKIFIENKDEEKRKNELINSINDSLLSEYSKEGIQTPEDLIYLKKKIYNISKIKPEIMLGSPSNFSSNNPYKAMKEVPDSWTPNIRRHYEKQMMDAPYFKNLQPGTIFLKEDGDGNKFGVGFWNHATLVRGYEKSMEENNKLLNNRDAIGGGSKTAWAHQKLFISSWPGKWFDNNDNDSRLGTEGVGWEKRFMWQYMDEPHCKVWNKVKKGETECLPYMRPTKYMPMGKRIRRKKYPLDMTNRSKPKYMKGVAVALHAEKDLIGEPWMFDWIGLDQGYTCSSLVALAWRHFGNRIHSWSNAYPYITPDDVDGGLDTLYDWTREEFRAPITGENLGPDSYSCEIHDLESQLYTTNDLYKLFYANCGDWKIGILDRSDKDIEKDELCNYLLDKMDNNCSDVKEKAEALVFHNSFECYPMMSYANIKMLKSCLTESPEDGNCISAVRNVVEDQCPKFLHKTMGKYCEKENMLDLLYNSSTEEEGLSAYKELLNNSISSDEANNAIRNLTKCHGWFDKYVKKFNKEERVECYYNYELDSNICEEVLTGNNEFCIKLITYDDAFCKRSLFNDDRSVNSYDDNFYCGFEDGYEQYEYFDQQFWDEAEANAPYYGNTYIIQDELKNSCGIYDNLY